MFTSLSTIVTAVLLVCSIPALGQSTWYVDDDNCPGPGTGGQGDPFCAIRSAIDASTDGDTVIVADGTYTGEDNRDLDIGSKLITIRSVNGPATCVIDCESMGRAFEISGGARVEAFTMRNGLALHGGAMFISGNPTIVGCVFEQNVSTGDGGAIYNLAGSPTMINCLFVANDAADFGGVLFSDLAAFTMVNCTLSRNTAFVGGGIRNYAAVEMTLTNCILWGNQDVNGGGLSGQIVSTSSAEFVNYCCIEGLDGAFGGEGNINADPLFINAKGGDHHLAPGSPCIDAGDSGALPMDVTDDLDSGPRYVEDPNSKDTGTGPPPIVDMGALEFHAGGAPIPAVSEWGLVVTSLVLVASGAVVFRNRRVRTSNGTACSHACL